MSSLTQEEALAVRAVELGCIPSLVPVIERLDRILAILEPLLADFDAGKQGAETRFREVNRERDTERLR
jgi:hypothetical protein